MNSEWINTTLGEFITLKRGYDLPKLKRNDGNIPVISSSGFSGTHDVPMVTGPGVVTGRYGTIGEVFYVPDDFWPINTTLYVDDFKGNSPLFVYYLLQTIDFHAYSDKAAVPGINRNHVHMANIKVPKSVLEQEKIASILKKIEDRIYVNQKINDILEQIAQAIFKSWFVDYEPVKAKLDVLNSGGTEEEALCAAMAVISGKDTTELVFFNNEHPTEYSELKMIADSFPSAMTESEFGNIPLGWYLSEIGNEVKVVGGATPSTKEPAFWANGSVYWATPKDLSNKKDKVLNRTERKITSLGVSRISSGVQPENTILLSSRAPVGYLAITKVPVAINQGYIAMQCNKILPPEYVLQWATHSMREITIRSSGSTFAEISKKNFKTINIVVPPSELLMLYVKYTRKIYDQIDSKIKENSKLQELKKSLLPKLLANTFELEGIHL
ncbi:TPA: restriction endonuclease subunit S [Klebsiella aerogenes]|uniref:restriction endonuclease subunit S n=1 Tax=Klebsiella TaxID=570 RepID=UPI000657B9BF|nr:MULTISPECIES: restriction endonuclease subunit S [Klebsiella]EKU4918067.1 restriction endonuclease subunit S [Klebsiella pneumoniae]ELA2597053.1 restriction endonuclease subunit S [Klebsiella aerogenes]KMD19780.1 hypothetical protein SL72_03290 [Klebsiella pneumoniae]HBU9209232.1 restriction endonuclease subunit S [Klebsiella pneumoniae]HDU2658610.1 restriction endonuclease subunit S [Klebsiella pneumoniae]